MSSFMERIEKKLDIIELVVNRIDHSKSGSTINNGDTGSRVQNQPVKNESLITFGNESSSDQNSSFFKFMTHSNAELAASDQTGVNDQAISKDNLIVFSPPSVEDAENVPPSIRAEKETCPSVIPKSTKPFSGSGNKKLLANDKKEFRNAAQVEWSNRVKQINADCTFADELVGIKLFDMNATETESLLEEYEANFRRSLKNPLTRASSNNNLLTDIFDVRLQTTLNENEVTKPAPSTGSDKGIDVSSANFSITVIEDGSASAPEVASNQHSRYLLTDENARMTACREFLEIENVSHTKLEE